MSGTVNAGRMPRRVGLRVMRPSLTTKTPHRRTGAASSWEGESAQDDDGEPDTASAASLSATVASAGVSTGATAAR